jgi:integrase
MREELVQRNVATLIELPMHRPKEIIPWSADEATAFLEGTKDHKWHLGFVLAALYGMRRGEVVGLRWSDIDFSTRAIRVTQQAQWIDGVVRPGPLKTPTSNRILPLVPATELLFAEHLAKTGSDLAALIESDAPILAGPHHGYIGPDVLSNEFLKVSAELGLRRITIHVLRHTAATNLKNMGVPARDMQLILGHAHVSTTQQLYQHADAEGQRSALVLVSDRLTAWSNRGAGGQNWRSNAKVAEQIGDIRTMTSVVFGGPGGNRTRDILLKRQTL